MQTPLQHHQVSDYSTKLYHNQCLTYGFKGTPNALLETIILDKDNIHAWAILDSGVMSHFLMTEAHTANKEETIKQITFTLPDGNKVQLTHQCILDVPNLTQHTRVGHIIPGLTAHSLLSVISLYNAGCEITFTKIDVKVKYCGKVAMSGQKFTRTCLWMVVLTPSTTPTHQPRKERPMAPPPPSNQVQDTNTVSSSNSLTQQEGNMATTLETSSNKAL